MSFAHAVLYYLSIRLYSFVCNKKHILLTFAAAKVQLFFELCKIFCKKTIKD
jgi:hypothetical protein